MEDIVTLKEQLKRARKTALVLSTICVLLLMLAIFKHVQATEANRFAEEQRQLLEAEKRKVSQAKEEADRQRAIAEEARLSH
jgi:hypothetical protein